MVYLPRTQRAPAILFALVGQLASWGRAPAAQLPDSQHILRSARAAQADFESIRRHNLPTAFGHGGGPCDERIGRFCFWFGDDDTLSPPPEPARIAQARDRLIHRLDSAAVLLPGDEWIAGQRVRYLIESSRDVDALGAARACRAVEWWCRALVGLVLHREGEFAAADSAYQETLRDMPSVERCRWRDIGVLLEGELRRRYERLGCEARESLEDRVWRLAQPLYSRPGNDRRTEHFARVTMTRIAEHAASVYGVPWGDDLREITLRYGWPPYWTREQPGPSGSWDVIVTGHDPPRAAHLLPGAAALEEPGDAKAGDWMPDAPRPRELYAPPYAASLAALAHQVARFRRGDSCLVVAAYDVSRDTLFGGGSLDAALVLRRDEHGEPVIERRPDSPASDQIVAKAACAPLLLSLEIVSPSRRHAARARYGMHPPAAPGDALALSDVLLFDPPDSLPTQLAAALPYVRGSTVVDSRSRLGLFWETAGLDSGEAVTTVVSVLPVGTGWLRKAAESLRLAGRRASVRLEWREIPEHHGSVAGRALALDLRGLSPGQYRIEIVVQGPGGRRGRAQREITVRER